MADVPASVAHFPGLESIEPVGPATWRWRLERLGSGRLSLQTVYSCRYTVDAAARTVVWESVTGDPDNARVHGSWTVTASPGGARLRLQNTLSIALPVPALMRRPAEALLRTENERLVARYIANLKQTLSGGNGRLR